MTNELQQLATALQDLERATKDVLIYCPPERHYSTLALSAALYKAQRVRQTVERVHPEVRKTHGERR